MLSDGSVLNISAFAALIAQMRLLLASTLVYFRKREVKKGMRFPKKHLSSVPQL
jgi:hypothetical protein